jgi:hypothetical protein
VPSRLERIRTSTIQILQAQKALSRPDPPSHTVRTATCPRIEAKGIEIFRGPLDGLVTSKIRTVIDCARTLPFDEALAVADAALNDPDVSRDALMADALASPRTGRARVVRVVQHADPGVDNSFESVLRALCIDAGFEVETQMQIGDLGWCDIADRRCPATTGSRQAEPGAA